MPGLDLISDQIWKDFSILVHELAPVNKALLKKRDDIQIQIDNWHQENPGCIDDFDNHKKFLMDIGYLIPEGPDFSINTGNVDEEITTIAGPQLVVPINNARFALNAANARWGSLYDALYGTNVIPEDDGCERGGDYNERRGSRIIARTIVT